ncbi:MAG: family 10 glycosylhydrolase [Victivallales bacterium]|nr:family 10 glycosylhydrolase [Victivallales bacterium]
MKKKLIIGAMLALTAVLPGTALAQTPSTRGLFLASTGPRSEYARSFWWELSEAEIVSYLDRLQKAGVNELYPAAYGHGNYYFKTTHAAFPKGVAQDRLKIDPLAVLIREAHRRKMKVIPFFPFLVAGGEPYVKQSAGGTLPHLDWFSLNTRGERGRTLSFDPANPEVREYLNHLVEDLLLYDIDGLMLDYIRYLGTHMGYTPLARQAFKGKTGVDPQDLYEHPEAFSTNIVYCLNPDSWAGKDWNLSSLLALMNRINIPFKIVPQKADIFAQAPANGTILISSYYDISQDVIGKLDAYVKGGGNVIFLDAPTTAMKTRSATLGPVLGMKSGSQWTAVLERTLAVKAAHPITAGVTGGTLTSSANALTEIVPDTAEILASFASGHPAVVLNTYGKGRCVVFNFQMLIKYEGEVGDELLGNTVSWLLAKRGDEPGSKKLAALNAAWIQYRSDQVTEVVKMVRETMRKRKPKLLLGAATTPKAIHVNTVFQEWKTWLKRGYMDVAYPMDYYASVKELRAVLAWQAEGIPKSQIVPLLSIYKREGGKVVPVTPERINDQLDLVRKLGFAGAGLFSNQRLSPKLEAALSARGKR